MMQVSELEKMEGVVPDITTCQRKVSILERLNIWSVYDIIMYCMCMDNMYFTVSKWRHMYSTQCVSMCVWLDWNSV